MIRHLLRALFPKPQSQRSTWDMLQAELDRARMIRRAGVEAVKRELDS
jgi:hypothetical protein